MNTLHKIRKCKKKICELAERYGMEHLRVFGSVARNEDIPGSDVDFLVRIRDGADLLDLIAFSQDLEELLQQKTDVVTEDELSPHFKNLIFREAIVI